MQLASILAIAAAAAQSVLAASASSGSFTCLAFNVAGLPAALQSNGVPGDKATVAGEIGTYFAQYKHDVIHLQEDFNYHAYIYATDTHPYRTATSGGAAIGSGLNSLSNYPFYDLDRVKWNTCYGVLNNGDDCLTPKGFTFMRVRFDEGVYIDFYNLHADAGDTDGDEAARTDNIKQLANYIDTNSSGNAVVVFGDTNSRYTRAKDNIPTIVSQNGLTDAWVQLIRGGSAPAAGADALVCATNPSTVQTCEVVDKVLYRSGGVVNLSAKSFQYAGAMFLQPDGNIMSDHDPVLVGMNWQLKSRMRASDLFGGPHGTWYNDISVLPATPVKATVLTFRGGNRVDNVGLTLANGRTLAHGGTGGTAASLTLGASEYWASTVLCEDQYNGHTRIFYIKATTSTGRVLSVGKTTSDCVTYTAPSGYQVVGFYGSSGDELDRVGFYYGAV